MIRPLLTALLAFALAACATQQSVAPPPVAVWAHEASDLLADPGVRYGRLANGLRYAIMPNQQPAGVAAIRLRIAAGAVQEADDQEGFAHLLEHMAFNGSANVPEGEMVKLLERLGLAFGPDTNAYTGFRETVYSLDLPNVREPVLDAAFMLLRETADKLLLDQAAIDREKGVVLAEERARDTPDVRAFEARLKFWLQGQRLPQRFPIGQTDDIKAATSARLRDYYETYYRPERALLVVTGDIDPAMIEKRIAAGFADWAPARGDGADPDLGAPAPRGLAAEVVTAAQGPNQAALVWADPPDLRADVRDLRIAETRLSLALAVVNRRLERLARGAEAPFIAARAFQDDLEASAEVSGLSVTAAPGAWEGALAAAEAELRRALEHGLTQAELQREAAELRAALEAAAAAAETRTTASLADGIAQHAHNRWVFTHPEVDLSIFDAAVAGFDAAAAGQALRTAMAGQGPLLFLASSEPVPGGAAALEAAYVKARAAPVAKPVETPPAVFDYTFGAPGKVTARARDLELDALKLRFANGVRATIKRTPFEADQAQVRVRIAGGQRVMPQTGAGLAWAAPFAFSEGGLGRLDKEALDQALAGKVIGFDFDIAEDAFVLSGVARRADLEAQLALLAAYVVDPGWRPEGLARLQSFAETQFAQLGASPGRVLGRDAPGLIRKNDARWRFPSLAEAQALRMDQIKAALAPALKSGAIEIAIVGDVTEADAEALLAKTFAALPARAAPGPIPDARAAPAFAPGGADPIRLTHEGRADQALGYIAYRGLDFADPRRARAQKLAAELVQLRLTEEVRERLGAAYSPSAGDYSSAAFPGFGYIAATGELPPDRIAEFFAILDQIAKELTSGPLDPDLLARARAPLIEAAENAEKRNGYWLSALSTLQTDPRTEAAIENRVQHYREITAAEIQAVAKEVLRPEGALRIIVAPANLSGSASPSP